MNLCERFLRRSRSVRPFKSPVFVASGRTSQSRNVFQSSPGPRNFLHGCLTKVVVSRLKRHTPHLFAFHYKFRKAHFVQVPAINLARRTRLSSPNSFPGEKRTACENTDQGYAPSACTCNLNRRSHRASSGRESAPDLRPETRPTMPELVRRRSLGLSATVSGDTFLRRQHSGT